MSELAKWRIEKAENNFQEGVILLNAGFMEGAVNRFYYAAFTSVRALLALKNLDSSKHSGIISLFNKEFVKKGEIDRKASKIISKTFSERSRADYTDFKEFNKEEVKIIKEEVRELMDEVTSYINSKM